MTGDASVEGSARARWSLVFPLAKNPDTILRRLGTLQVGRIACTQAFCELGRVHSDRLPAPLHLRRHSGRRPSKEPPTRARPSIASSSGPSSAARASSSENSRDEQKEDHQIQPPRCQLFDLPQFVLTDPARPRPGTKGRERGPEDAIAAISPYLTEHINRFGDYTLNLGENRPSPTTATLSENRAATAA